MMQNSQYLDLDDPMSSGIFQDECEDGIIIYTPYM